VQRGDQWASTSHVSNNVTGATTRTAQGSGGGAAATRSGAVGTSGVAKGPGGEVYAGHDGNVYRNQGGSWQKYDSGGWNSVPRPAAPSGLSADRFGGLDSSTFDPLNRDSSARSDGALRASDWDNVRSGGFGGDSFRPSGDGFSGGGLGGGGFGGGGLGGGGFRGGGRR